MWLWVFDACIPAHLQKYQEKHGKSNQLSHEVPALNQLGPAGSTREYEGNDSREKESFIGLDAHIGDQRNINEDEPFVRSKGTFYQTDQNTYFIGFHETDVWETILDVLIKNYSLAIVDKDDGVLSTDWDSFYIGKRVYRNKLSFRIKKTLLRGERQKGVEFVVHNNVERLGDSHHDSVGFGFVWLPAQDPIDEITRIVQNMALLFKIPPPSKIYDGKKYLGKSHQKAELR